MDKETSEKRFINIPYGSSDFKNYVQHLSDVASSGDHHLSIFLGWYQSDKRDALDKLAKATELPVETFDFNELVSKNEEDTFLAFDELFERYPEDDHILYFANGDKLCGAYTGFTHSKVKYATPQERYFLDKVRETHGISIIDITENDSADKTIRRMAQSVITFRLPDSPVKRFFWHLKNYSLHGYDIKTKRPEEYAETSGPV